MIDYVKRSDVISYVCQFCKGFSYCSCCDSVSPHEDQYGEYCDEPNYCPNCGADMRGDSDV